MSERLGSFFGTFLYFLLFSNICHHDSDISLPIQQINNIYRMNASFLFDGGGVVFRNSTSTIGEVSTSATLYSHSLT